MFQRFPRLCIVFGLVTLTLIAFTGVCGNGFVNYDDDHFVTRNPGVQAGLTWSSLRWAWTYLEEGLWEPVTWMSLQLDYQLFRLDPAGYHATNLLFHLANVLLVFWLLARWTGALWCSALAAALFAVHPLRVESVAWISERKDVLSVFFGLLALVAYDAYVRRPGLLRYLSVVVLFGLSLLAKPMLVTLPVLLLLLDYWPLERTGLAAGNGSPRARRLFVRLIAEKVPLLALALAVSVVTLAASRHAGALVPTDESSVVERCLHVPLHYAEYLSQTAWPVDLLPFYPMRPAPWWCTAGAAVLLIVIFAFVLFRARRQRYLPSGWLWFLIALLPVIGLVQAGGQAHADRYTYWPHIGLFLMLAWGMRDLVRRWPALQTAAIVASCAAVLTGALVARVQVAYWHDSYTLWQHALAVDDRNCVAHNHLGLALMGESKLEEACRHFMAAVETSGNGYAAASNNLGICLMKLRQPAAAVLAFSEAVRLQPQNPEAHFHVAGALSDQGKLAAALPHYQEAVRLRPDVAAFRLGLAYTLHELGQTADAQTEYQHALRLDPGWPEQANAVAWALATHPQPSQRDGPEAVRLAKQVCQSGPPAALFLDTLAAAYANIGDFEKAVATARRALALATEHGPPDLAQEIRRRLVMYENRQAYYEGPASSLFWP
jgi:Flp pilus assembly protein TadD